MGEAMRLGIDLGGTKIEAAILNNNGHMIWQKRQQTSKLSYDETITRITGLVDDARQSTGFAGPIGIGVPGSIRRSTGKSQGASLTYLNNRDLQSDLKSALNTDVRMANDANCFALSEATDGAGKGCEVVFGLI